MSSGLIFFTDDRTFMVMLQTSCDPTFAAVLVLEYLYLIADENSYSEFSHLARKVCEYQTTIV